MGSYIEVATQMSEVEEETCVAIFRSVMRCNHRLLKLGAEVAAEFGLHLAEVNVVDMLGKHGPLTMGDLSGVTFISPSNTTHTVKKLESTRLVKRKRSLDSERVVTVCLTAKGEKLYKQTYPKMLNSTKKLISDSMSALERKQVKELLQRLAP